MAADPPVIGVVLAGGAGTRMGGDKASVALHGRPLVSYPAEAVQRALGHVVIVTKPESELPDVPGATVWTEPSTPYHPLVGLLYALEMAGDTPIVVCAGDLPFVTPRLVRHLADSSPQAGAVITRAAGRDQPLLGRYHPRCTQVLRGLDPHAGASVQDAVARLAPVVLDVEDPQLLFNVNTPADLLQATAMIDARRRASRT